MRLPSMSQLVWDAHDACGCSISRNTSGALSFKLQRTFGTLGCLLRTPWMLQIICRDVLWCTLNCCAGQVCWAHLDAANAATAAKICPIPPQSTLAWLFPTQSAPTANLLQLMAGLLSATASAWPPKFCAASSALHPLEGWLQWQTSQPTNMPCGWDWALKIHTSVNLQLNSSEVVSELKEIRIPEILSKC